MLARTSWLLAGFMVVAGCQPATPLLPKSSGSIGLSTNDQTLYVADADNNDVVVVDTKSMGVVTKIPVGHSPARIFVGPNGSVFVTNRGDRTVMRIDPTSLRVVATGAVGAEPVGLSLTGDGSLVVANSESGSLSVLDAKTLASEREIHVGGHPYAVAVTATGHALVTDYLGGSVLDVDLASHAVVSTASLAHSDVTECQWGPTPARTPAEPADVVLSPDGSRAYVAHVLSRTGTDGMNFQGLALAVAPALSTVDTATGQTVSATTPGVPEPLLLTTDSETCAPPPNEQGMDAPSSLVVDASGQWIYVADHNSDAVAIISATGRHDPDFLDPDRGIVALVRVGARPTGLAVRGDLSALYVYDAFDHDIRVVTRTGNTLAVTGRLVLATSNLSPAVDRGRRLFYSAVDPRMTAPTLGGVSCSSCHPDGRTDGLSWALPDMSFGAAARNTPALWGVASTAPYQWDGATPNLPQVAHVMVGWMNGSGIDTQDAQDLVAYMQTITPPDNPNRGAEDATLVAQGKAIFDAQCADCHTGSSLTDQRTHLTADGMAADTPSLVGVFATAPYLEDGSAQTLGQAIRSGVVDSGDGLGSHDLSGKLTSSQMTALEAYLKTL